MKPPFTSVQDKCEERTTRQKGPITERSEQLVPQPVLTYISGRKTNGRCNEGHPQKERSCLAVTILHSQQKRRLDRVRTVKHKTMPAKDSWSKIDCEKSVMSDMIVIGGNFIVVVVVSYGDTFSTGVPNAMDFDCSARLFTRRLLCDRSLATTSVRSMRIVKRKDCLLKRKANIQTMFTD